LFCDHFTVKINEKRNMLLVLQYQSEFANLNVQSSERLSSSLQLVQALPENTKSRTPANGSASNCCRENREAWTGFQPVLENTPENSLPA